MRKIVEPVRETPVVAEVDVLVVGGGPSGVAAAVAAGRAGARTMLVERYGCLGGLATGGLVLHLMAMYDRDGRRWIGGIGQEVVERLAAMGGLAWEGPTRPHADSEALKVVADNLCLEAGVALRLHSWAVGALVEDGRVRGVLLESKAGRHAVLCGACVDATGDADVAAYAGAACASHTMAIGMPLKLGGIDLGAWSELEQREPRRAADLVERVSALGGYPLRPRPTPWSDAGVYWVNIPGLARRAGAGPESNSGASLQGALDGTSVEDLTWAEVELRRRTLLSVDFYRKHAPGFARVQLLAFASQLGVRDGRHIEAEHLLSEGEVESAKACDDAIGCVAIGASKRGHAALPYRCLVPRSLEGLLAAGRSVSGDDWVMETLRLIPPAMVSGQAAGTAAALAVSQGVALRAVGAARLRERLAREGVILPVFP